MSTNASKFYCDSHTGGSCRFWSCSSSRGPTMCKSSQCRCMPGFCAIAGVCNERTNDNVANVADTCNRDTGGSCRFFGCSSYRGAVDCIDGACVCNVGYCSADDGSCHPPKAKIKAHVVPVNLQQRNFPSSQAAESAQRFCFRTIRGEMLSRAKNSFNLFPDLPWRSIFALDFASVVVALALLL